MGRKRTSNKRNLNLWVDKDLVDQLNKLKVIPSVFFTEQAEELLRRVESGEIEIDEVSENEEQ